MRATKSLFGLLLAAIVIFVPAAFAATPVVHVLGSGSSALFQAAAVAAVNDLAKTSTTCAGGVGVSCSIHHYTIKNGGDCTSVAGGLCSQLFDDRVNGGVTPGLQGGNIWIAWVTCLVAANCPGYAVGSTTDVWGDVSVDSTVGVRSFLARGATGGVATSLRLVSNVEIGGAAPAQLSDNAISPLLFAFGVLPAASGTNCAAGSTTCDDAQVPADLYAAITSAGGAVLNAGFTDIRMEDAKYANKRINKPFDNGGYFLGLGYSTAGSALVGNLIKSGIHNGSTLDTASAEPDNFSLPGGFDPFNNSPVPTTITTIPIGESPILFLANRTNATGLGVTLDGEPYYNNFWDNVPNTPAGSGFVTKLGKLWFGKDCSGAAAAFWNTGVVGPQPASGGFTAAAFAAPVGGTYPAGGANPSNGVWKVVAPGNGGPGTLDIKIDPASTTFAGPWAVGSATPPPAGLVDGAGIVLTGTTDGAGHSWDGVYQIVPGGVSGEAGAGLDATANKIEVTAWSGFNTGGLSTAFIQNPEAEMRWFTIGPGFNLHLFVREALSGTYNTTEFTVIREFGGPTGPTGGSNDSPTTAASNKSMDADYSDINVGTVPAQLPNPMSSWPCWWSSASNTPPSGAGFGDRTRVIGTGEMVSGAKVAGVAEGGILNQADALGYAFFSFGNVSAIGKSNSYGYLQLDGIDGVFASYHGTAGFDLGEPSGNVAGALDGQLPKCDFTGATAPFCKANAIWDTTHACAGGAAVANGCSYPHLRDGTYRAWSLLRVLCDTADVHCLSGTDSLGTQALVAAAQADIDNSTGVPDFLPFQDAKFYRSHFVPGLWYDNNVYNYSSAVSFFDPGSSSFGQTPDNAPEAGGDVGGCILPLPASNAPATNLGCQQ